MMNVQKGDFIKATGLGAIMTKLVQGSTSEGTVVHTAGDLVTDIELQAQILSGFPTEFLHKGILYKDTGSGKILWLAKNDFEVVESEDIQ